MLKGTLDDFTLPDIFRFLSLAKKTGELDVTRSAGQGKVYFRDGEVYFAESSLQRDPIGQKLVRMRVVTEGQLRKALDEHASGGDRLGRVLVAQGVVTEDQLETALRGQIEDSVFDLLRWELGDFSWEPNVEIDPEVFLSVSVENLIMEASRRLDELEVIRRKIPSETTVLEMAQRPPEGAAEINITPDEWRILVLVNGQRTVADVAESAGLDTFECMKTLYGLVSAGLLEAPGGSAAIAELGAMDDDLDTDLQTQGLGFTPQDVAGEEAHPLPQTGPSEQPEADAGVELEDEDAGDTPSESDGDALGSSALEAGTEETPDEEPAAASSEPGLEEELFGETTFDNLADDGSLEDSSPGGGMDLLDRADVDETAPEGSFDLDEQPSGLDLPTDDETSTEAPVEATVEESSSEPTTAVSADESPVRATFPPPSGADVAADDESGRVTKLAAVRELSDLFNQSEADASVPSFVPLAREMEVGSEEEEIPEPPETPRRVEDDEEITRSLISRLIDGVKGL